MYFGKKKSGQKKEKENEKSQVTELPPPVKKHEVRGRSLGKWWQRKHEKLKSR